MATKKTLSSASDEITAANDNEWELPDECTPSLHPVELGWIRTQVLKGAKSSPETVVDKEEEAMETRILMKIKQDVKDRRKTYRNKVESARQAMREAERLEKEALKYEALAVEKKTKAVEKRREASILQNEAAELDDNHPNLQSMD
jgi:hypothetical protein